MADFFAKGNKPINGYAEPKSEWSYLGQTTGNAEITIPENATEVIGYCLYSTNIGSVFHFITIQDDLWVRQGYYHNSTNYGTWIFKWVKSTRRASTNVFQEIGTDKISQTTTKWYIK